MKEAGKGNDGLCSGRAQLASVFYDTSHFITSCKKTWSEQILSLFFLLHFLQGEKYTRESSFQPQSLSLQDKYVGKAACQTDGFTLGYILPCHKNSIFFGNVK